MWINIFYRIDISWFSPWTLSEQIYTTVFQSLSLFSTPSLFVGWLKVHGANYQTISSYPVRFSTDIVNNNNIFLFLFYFGLFCFSIFAILDFRYFLLLFGCVCVCVCVRFLFETKNIYSDRHLTIRADEW